MNEAALLAARRDKTAVDMRDFDDAIDRLIAGLEKKRVINQKEREIVAYHESGHAIVATPCPAWTRSTRSRSWRAASARSATPCSCRREDRYLMQKQDLMNQLAVLLGGRSAEEIALGEISTGAQNDLQRATDIARSMVTEWGMSDRMGVVHFEPTRRNRFLDVPLPAERGAYSEDTAQLIDAEVKQLITHAHQEARRILRDQRELLERVTRRLLEQEVMEGEELRAMIAAGPTPLLAP